jgi:hypothetical protein
MLKTLNNIIKKLKNQIYNNTTMNIKLFINSKNSWLLYNKKKIVLNYKNEIYIIFIFFIFLVFCYMNINLLLCEHTTPDENAKKDNIFDIFDCYCNSCEIYRAVFLSTYTFTVGLVILSIIFKGL